MQIFSIVIATLIGCSLPARASSFANLGFEDSKSELRNLPPKGGSGPASELLPGWTVINGLTHNTEPVVSYNYVAFDFDNVSLYDGRSAAFLQVKPSEGIWYLGMTAIANGASPDLGFYSIQQSGEIPIDAKLVLFDQLSGKFRVSVNGSPLSTAFVDSAWAADVSDFAGQTVVLKFEAVPYDAGPVGGAPYFAIDNIRFSHQVVPEPSTFALLGVGLVSLGCAARSKRKPRDC